MRHKGFKIFCNSAAVVDNLTARGLRPSNKNGTVFTVLTRESPSNWCLAAFKGTGINHYVDYYIISIF